MAGPGSEPRLLQLERYKNATAAKESGKCPKCDGTGYIKGFTPWGCPVNSPCSCKSHASMKSPRDVKTAAQ